MKRYVFLLMFLLLGILAFSQQFLTVSVNPQILPPKAPFTVYVNSNSHDFNVTSIVATCNGTSQTAKLLPAEFTFNAPILKKGQRQKRLIVRVMVRTTKGEKMTKDVSVIISNDAKPVITIEKPSPSNNDYISKRVSFPVKVYAGFGVSEIDFMVDKTIIASECEFSTQILGIYSHTYKVNTEKMKLSNGWHTFSVKVVSVTDQVYSKIASYYVNNESPTIKLSRINECLAAGTCVHVKMEVLSPIGVKEVDINGQPAKREEKNTWDGCVTTPSTTGKWIINVVASDLAENTSSTSVSVYIDGQKPVINLTNDANLVEGNAFWKRAKPLSMKISFSASSEKCGIKPITSVRWKNSEGKMISTTTSVNLFTPDTYTVEATVVDPVNNKKATLNKTFAIKFDNAPPSIMGTPMLKVDYCHSTQQNYVNNKEYTVVGPSSTITVEIRATDNDGVGIKNVFAPLVKATNNDNMWTFNISQLKAGENNIPLNVTLTDKLGNSTTVNWIEHIFLDDSAPLVHISLPNAMQRNGIYWSCEKPLNVQVKATTMSRIPPKCVVEVNGVSEGKNFKINEDGTYRVTIISTNVVNCMSTKVSTVLKVKFDTQSPQIVNVGVTPDRFKTRKGQIVVGPTATLTVKVKVKDTGVGIKYVSVNGIKASLRNGFYVVKTIPNVTKSGTYSLNIKAVDYCNNTSEKSTSVFVDTASPTITCTLWPDNYFRNDVYWSKKNVPFYIGVKAITDSGVNPITTSALNGKEFSEATLVSMAGTYSLSCVATNPVNGKVSKYKKSMKLGFDSVPPDILSIDVPATLGPNQKFEVCVNAKDDGIGVKYVEVNGKLMKNENENTWYATLTTPNWNTSKRWNLKISAVDKFGNVDSKKVSVFVDASAPTIKFYVGEKEIQDGFAGPLYFKTEPTIKYVAFTEGKVAPKVAAYLDCDKEITLPMKMSGIHFVSVEATNQINGKTTHFSAKFLIAVDDELPYVDVKSPQTMNAMETNSVKITARDSNLRYASFKLKSQGKTLYSAVYPQSEESKSVDLKKALVGINGQNVELILKAEDMSGNVSSIKKNVYVDTMPPYIQGVHFEDNELTIKFNEPIFGKPYVKLIQYGKIIWEGIATISNSGNCLVAKPNVKLSFNTYEVEIRNVTDKVGNKIGNNFTPWSF